MKYHVIKIRPVSVELFHVDRQTDRPTWQRKQDFSAILLTRLKQGTDLCAKKRRCFDEIFFILCFLRQPIRAKVLLATRGIKSFSFSAFLNKTRTAASSFTLHSSVYYLQWIIGPALWRMGLCRGDIWWWGLAKHLLQVTVVLWTAVETKVKK